MDSVLAGIFTTAAVFAATGFAAVAYADWRAKREAAEYAARLRAENEAYWVARAIDMARHAERMAAPVGLINRGAR
jgi:hypothetical protein